jgi:hypothetical protein
MPQQQQRGRRRPVKIVEHEHRASLARHGLDQRRDRLEERKPLRLGVGTRRLSQLRKLGQQPGELGREGTQIGPHPLGPQRARHRAKRLHERLVGHGKPLVAAPIENRAEHAASELGGKPGLADPGLAGQHDGDTVPAPPQLAQPRELRFAAHKRRVGRDLKRGGQYHRLEGRPLGRRRRRRRERLVLRQDRLFELAELRARLDPELLNEDAAGLLVGGQRLSLTAGAVEG